MKPKGDNSSDRQRHNSLSLRRLRKLNRQSQPREASLRKDFPSWRLFFHLIRKSKHRPSSSKMLSWSISKTWSSMSWVALCRISLTSESLTAKLMSSWSVCVISSLLSNQECTCCWQSSSQIRKRLQLCLQIKSRWYGLLKREATGLRATVLLTLCKYLGWPSSTSMMIAPSVKSSSLEKTSTILLGDLSISKRSSGALQRG